MLSPGRFLEQARNRPLRSLDELALHLVSKLVAAGWDDEFNLDYRIKAQIELGEGDLEVLPPAFAKVYAEVLRFDVKTYFRLVEWFEEPSWTNPPNICRCCGAPPEPKLEEGLCKTCVWIRTNRKRITSRLSQQMKRLPPATKRIS